MTSSAYTCERRRGISTSTPRRASLYARSPPTFTAEAAGTGSSTTPRRGSSAASSSAAAGAGCDSSGSPSGSPVVVVDVRSTSATYCLSSPTKHGANLVAAPDNKSNKPVAKGSRVPVWPVRARVRRRSWPTSAKDEGPAGLSTRAAPTGLSARGGIRGLRAGRLDEGVPDELGDLLERPLRREARRLPVAAAAGAAGDRRDVDLVVARAQRDPARRAVAGHRRLADQRDHLRALDRAQVVDDPFRVRLLGADGREVLLREVRDDQAPALVQGGVVERAREQLQLRELDGLVHVPEDAVHVGA